MKTTVIIVRHGQSEGNLKDLFIGVTDSPLSPLGLKQAEKTAEYLSTYKIDKIYSSPLNRAMQTASAIAKKQNLNIIKEKGLIEIDGGKWEGMPFKSLKTEFKDSYGLWLKDVGYAAADGGESFLEVYLRLKETVLRLVKENLGKTVLLSTHATAGKCIECLLKTIPLSKAKDLPWLPNASVSVAEVDEHGNAQVKLWGENGFLGDMATELPKGSC